MPVMKQLRIGSETYDTVGEASVTQTLTSGTKIATVTIDGTATDLYAPEGGGGGPEPSSTTPAMDGTAAAGTSTDYARADHVHPTDTSRQEKLVSGTNIKTVGGTSLLGSGDVSVVRGITFGDPHDTYVVPVSGATAYINLGDGLSVDDSGNKVTISADIPSAGSTAPKMDGTAAVGTSTDYARADHVHPTDTSRAAASHTHAIADVTGLQTALDGKQPTLVSGTNIKTVNGTSLLGSGNISTAELPSVTSSDNGKVLRVVSGEWAAASLPSASGVSF